MTSADRDDCSIVGIKMLISVSDGADISDGTEEADTASVCAGKTLNRPVAILRQQSKRILATMRPALTDTSLTSRKIRIGNDTPQYYHIEPAEHNLKDSCEITQNLFGPPFFFRSNHRLFYGHLQSVQSCQ